MRTPRGRPRGSERRRKGEKGRANDGDARRRERDREEKRAAITGRGHSSVAGRTAPNNKRRRRKNAEPWHIGFGPTAVGPLYHGRWQKLELDEGERKMRAKRERQRTRVRRVFGNDVGA